MEFDSKKIRNVALLGHGKSGKTSLAEAMLYISKGTDRLGKIADGNTVCDNEAEEIQRGFSISSTSAPVYWKEAKINIFDTPGYIDFAGECAQALRVADSAIIVLDARAGIEVGTEIAWDYATDAGIPKAFFINKFDDNEARFGRLIDALHDRFGKSVCPITITMVKDGEVVGAIDLVDMEAHRFDDQGHHSIHEIPEESMEAANKYRDMLLEAIATTDEELMAKYFEGETITHMECVNAIHEGIIYGDIVPLFCGVATKLWGVWTLLDKISESFPRHLAKKTERLLDGSDIEINAEGEPAIFVFKTVADPYVGKMTFFKVMNGTLKRDMTLKNQRTGEDEKVSRLYVVKGKKQVEVEELSCGDIGMIPKLNNTATGDTLTWNTQFEYAKISYPIPSYSRSIVPAGKGDENKISSAISRMLEEDYTLKYENNAETKQQIIYGMGEMHLAVLQSRLKSRFGVNVDYGDIKIAYRERITKPVDVEGKHKKQNGGSGQYGHVKIRFAPSDMEGLTFSVSVVGGSVPKNFYPAVEKGLQEAMLKGAVGYPLTQLSADLYDGSYHDVDSDELSFKSAAALAYRKCLELANPILLEPTGELEVIVPDDIVGDVMGDLNKRRGGVTGMEPSSRKGYTVVKANIPRAEILEYPTVLRALSQGKGSFTFIETGYGAVPESIAVKVRESAKNE